MGEKLPGRFELYLHDILRISKRNSESVSQVKVVLCHDVGTRLFATHYGESRSRRIPIGDWLVSSRFVTPDEEETKFMVTRFLFIPQAAAKQEETRRSIFSPGPVTTTIVAV